MEKFALWLLQFVAVVILFTAEWPGGVQGGENLYAGRRVTSDLLRMQAVAEDGVIHLNDDLVEKFASPGPEPRRYMFFIFFDAAHMRDNAELNLAGRRELFGQVATAFLKNNRDMMQQVFFAEVNFEESRWSFENFRVTSLPQVKYLPPGNGSLEESESMDWNKEGMAQFVEAKATQKVELPIVDSPPGFTSKDQLIVFGVGLLVFSPFAIHRIMTKETLMHDPKFWIFNALLVYFFIMSGGMLDLIQGTPGFVLRDPKQLRFFITGSRQLGAEGFVIACLYTLVGLLLAFATHFLHQIRSKHAQRILLLLMIGISFLAVRQVISLYNWKTNSSIHGYWPSALSPVKSHDN